MRASIPALDELDVGQGKEESAIRFHRVTQDKMIGLALLFGFAILINGSSFAAIHGRFAQQLEIPGSAAIPYFPWIILAAYIVAVTFIKPLKKGWMRWCSFILATLIGNILIGYPVVILNRGSTRITAKEEISREDLASFEARFPVLVASYFASHEGHVVRVRNDQYSQDMPEFLNQLARNKQNKKMLKGQE